MATITKLKIHPSIGVARIGNHPTEFFIGPEVPNGFIKSDEIGGFKTEDVADTNILKIKRQGARFRVFAYFDDGTVKELNSDNAEIIWRVKIANTKARGLPFYGVSRRGNPPTRFRNDFVKNEARKNLGLEPDEISVFGNNQAEFFKKVKFRVRETDGTMLISDDVLLGECKTDEKGRLIVLGGFGKSGTVKDDPPIGNYANNDYWYDDISDGYVKATVKITETGAEMDADDAWVLCVPPKYVPEMHPIITLQDMLFNRFWKAGIIEVPEKPLFYRDIYPILKRAENLPHIHRMPGRHGTIRTLLEPDASADDKLDFLDRLRKLDGSGGNMPRMFGDDYDVRGRTSRVTLTEYQLRILNKWVNDDFEVDAIENTQPGNEITPVGLDQASLENCVGGAFFPGIEASWYLREDYQFIEPFRLDSSQIVPGDVTKQMALPWQADFLDCVRTRDPGELNKFVVWWAYSRPDDTFFEGASQMHEWTPPSEFARYEDMVEKWMKLGFVVEKNGKYVEVQRQIPPAV